MHISILVLTLLESENHNIVVGLYYSHSLLDLHYCSLKNSLFYSVNYLSLLLLIMSHYFESDSYFLIKLYVELNQSTSFPFDLILALIVKPSLFFISIFSIVVTFFGASSYLSLNLNHHLLFGYS